MQSVTRRSVLAALGAMAASPLQAQLAQSPMPRPRPEGLEELVRAARPVQARSDIVEASAQLIDRFRLGGEVAFALADAQTGEVLAGRDAETPMAPASTCKTITTAYALEHLGAAYRFRTRILATGPLKDGRLEGDLILAGGGDPTLSSDDIDALLDQLAGLGLTEVTGRFLVWAGALPHVEEIDPGQPDHLGYNPSVSGLNLNFNRVHFQWKQQGGDYQLQMDARAGHVVPPVRMVTMSTSNRSGPIFTLDAEPGGTETWTVARPALGGEGARWLPVRNAAGYTAEVMRTLAAMRRPALALPEPEFIEALPPAVPVALHQGPPLAEVARDMLKYSTNLTAEVLGLTASVARTGTRPRDLADSAAEMTRWAQGFGMTESQLVDHSGLGPESRVTARDMTRLLHHVGIDGPLWPLLKPVHLSDKNGRAEPFELRAKTGTLNFVSCLVGYVRRPGKRAMIFAILTAEPERRAAIAPGDEERPAGSHGWTTRSRALQYDLIRLWSDKL
ncbi:D-alanyl-D-alanine carboxypeptidase/D-alanyl-D-alanine endopeptidase [Mangrovicoccus algicola]|uniref:D-alanyl-D-alanine carboxypeptidase/D-alanyl-D-alanine-endopeptidase n=1 Tax=Mangrovicoccus algicola TaxID=2771008 RepID=A0A8J6YVS1_9RHOB|nr:D-alanyl-D-alanine carboxypeptidase/D-alanyl-D-alanine-endopeptidase [Mangrovicoccus algicola]MBE3636968.1 D-alanyl-D-alanine carboxypeptidase/D-alanyl-D-alanine-endopeptidase [Mangrovicoccus algicola]